MSVCYAPIKAYKDAEGNVIFNNDKGRGIHELPLPCGQCIGCRLNHAEGWAIRMVHEAQLHDENSFLTLTYSEENLPENSSLNYDHVTKFIKKLRKVLSKTSYKNKIKYYRVGEYGENFSRPHYHVILFGFDFSSSDIIYKGVRNKRQKWRTQPHDYYVSTLLSDLWSHGHCELGEVNYNTCMYVAKYVTKKVNGRLKTAHYQRILPSGEIVSVEQEKSSMSRKNAIGKEWLTKFWSDVYPNDFVEHQGRKLKVPKYYDKHLEKTNPSLYEKVKMEREASMLDRDADPEGLLRSYEVKILNRNLSSRSLDGAAPISQVDRETLNYKKNEACYLRERKKNG